ncbi:vesicular glutamate transporter 1-like [Centruroides sculpturatus]|uniref:vesicular glutamate transporter 1-like n=1 Tax=Centruroides sculpturatus TaxID=218467 RepID=UPI000C6D9772|nr:vesicular glutamate transporter 1-like [Centruroides sculpturatus]
MTTGYLCERKGWSSSFYCFGICGIVLSLCLTFTIYDRPQQHPRISDKELTFLNESIPNISSREKKLNIPWKQILTSRAVWIVALTKISWGFGYFAILTKFPSYLHIIQHFPIEKNGIMSALVYSVDAIIMFTSGFIADFMKSRDYLSISNIRKFSEGIGVLFGLTYGLCNAAGIFSSYVAGIILDENAGDMVYWNYVFYMASFAYFLGGVIFIFGATAEVQPWAIINTDNNKQDNN